MLRDLVIKNRSYRRFYEEKRIEEEQLLSLIDIARLTASSANMQPIRYIFSNEIERNEVIFKCLGWAGYLENWNGPAKGERPSAYIIMLTPNGMSSSHEEGIVGQTILLAATELGIGGCFLANIDRKMMRESLGIDKKFDIKLVIALGYPKENVVIEEISEMDDIKYYRDENKKHHVPKIRLSDLIINLKK